MKRVTLIFLSVVICAVATAQNNNDRAVIPVGVTLNSIMRLTIVSGGNIEFSFNSIRDYETGITNSTQYDTRFTVASSVNYSVSVQTEDANLVRTDFESDTITALGAGAQLALNNVAYEVVANAFPTNVTLMDGNAAPVGLSSSATIVAADAGGADDNDFTIHWECGAAQGTGTGVATSSLLAQSPAAGRYGTNVFLILSSQ